MAPALDTLVSTLPGHGVTTDGRFHFHIKRTIVIWRDERTGMPFLSFFCPWALCTAVSEHTQKETG